MVGADDVAEVEEIPKEFQAEMLDEIDGVTHSTFEASPDDMKEDVERRIAAIEESRRHKRGFSRISGSDDGCPTPCSIYLRPALDLRSGPVHVAGALLLPLLTWRAS